MYIPNSAPGAISTLKTIYWPWKTNIPDSLVIVLGDFNQTSLTKEMPRYKQQVKCPTHVKNNILDNRPLFVLFLDALSETLARQSRGTLTLSDICPQSWREDSNGNTGQKIR